MEKFFTKEYSQINATFLSWKILLNMVFPPFQYLDSKKEYNILSREKARESAIYFFNDVFKKYWINVEVNFSDEADNSFPEQVLALKEYIENWIITDEIKKHLSSLYLWNHTKWWIEAFGWYYLIPTDTRFQLKSNLALLPWIYYTDPIQFDRSKQTKEIVKKRNKKIWDTLEKWERIFIYPEWTRTKTWNLLPFKDSLVKKAFEVIKTQRNVLNSVVTIITTDSHKIFPYTIEEGLLLKWKLWKWDLTFTIDFIDISLYENVSDFNSAVKKIIEYNLNKKNSF